MRKNSRDEEALATLANFPRTQMNAGYKYMYILAPTYYLNLKMKMSWKRHLHCMKDNLTL